MSKHGNNNAQHVLKAEAANLRWLAHHLEEIAIKVHPSLNLLPVEKDRVLQVNEILMKLDNTRKELTTIIPKEHQYAGEKISRTA